MEVGGDLIVGGWVDLDCLEDKVQSEALDGNWLRGNKGNQRTTAV